ncbi:MAG: hypothetical protein V4764_02800 [Burkholderia sp.]
MKELNLMLGHGASYPSPAPMPMYKTSPARDCNPALAPQTMARIEREARSMQITPDQLVDRALLALADEVDAERVSARRKQESGRG